MNKVKKNIKRKLRIRKKIIGTVERPRLSIFRSNRYIYAQIIDDDKGKTLISASQKELEKKGDKKEIKPFQISKMIGTLLAKKALEKKISKVVFDRGSYLYHGKVKAFAEGARKGGLKF